MNAYRIVLDVTEMVVFGWTIIAEIQPNQQEILDSFNQYIKEIGREGPIAESGRRIIQDPNLLRRCLNMQKVFVWQSPRTASAQEVAAPVTPLEKEMFGS